MTVEATAHFDATAAIAATAAAAATGDGDAARGWLLFMKLLCGDRARGRIAEPVVDVFAPQAAPGAVAPARAKAPGSPRSPHVGEPPPDVLTISLPAADPA